MRDCDDYGDTRRMRGSGEPRVTIRAQAGSEPRSMLPDGPGYLSGAAPARLTRPQVREFEVAVRDRNASPRDATK